MQAYMPVAGRWGHNPLQYALTGVLFTCAAFYFVAAVSYFWTRPWVKIVVTPNTIRYGSRFFHREFHDGMRLGYSTNETDLKNKLLEGSFGTVAMRLTYGRWGEDLPYLVNKYHADEIVIWMNEIINSVGAPIDVRHDPYAGEKSELL
ncbi:hypothetical protein [Thalassobius sp. I31.1]|uniref:hypothetical protein n=1 Tax=Thalassobius sp. I31.1 TaxID=2109912 RepID=UPI0013002BED|nr:hypothetical protein [Thalassobius sp. I31.1]